MNVQLFQPGELLSPYIENYMLVDIDWRNMPSPATVWRLIPFGQISMLFLYGDPHGYNVTGAAAPMENTSSAFIVGQLTKPLWLKFSGRTQLIKIQFKPAGIRRLLPFNMDECTDVPSIDLETVWGAAVRALPEQLHSAKDNKQRVLLLEAFLEKRLLPAHEQAAYIEYTIRKLESGRGNINITGLEAKLGITGRHLERLFKARVGLTPKEIGKMIRLNYAFTCLEKNPGMSLTSLSHESGYYDQAHFSRDFKKIAGISPSRLLAANSSELFVTHGKCFMKNSFLQSA